MNKFISMHGLKPEMDGNAKKAKAYVKYLKSKDYIFAQEKITLTNKLLESSAKLKVLQDKEKIVFNIKYNKKTMKIQE